MEQLFIAFILGVVEGLTEFIPVSSTGHLIVLGDVFGFKGPDGKLFEIVIQMGAILAVCWYYRTRLVTTLLTLPHSTSAQRFTLQVTLAFVPAAFMGAMLHHWIKTVLFSPLIVGAMLIIGGLIILVIEKTHRAITVHSIEAISYKKAFLIGVFQCFALIPGTSRSGATIMGSLLLGIDRKSAAEFSFFLAIPTMLGATVFDIYKNMDSLTSEGLSLIAVGLFSAFVAALLVVSTLISFIEKHGFTPFAYYRIIVGIIILWWFL
jgi:undecaprenyl-diphosphatase